MARLESRARGRALQALYAWDVRGEAGLERVTLQLFDDLALGPDERKFANQLIAVVIKQGPAIDAQLADVTNNWRLERLGAIERSVLRLAAAELHPRRDAAEGRDPGIRAARRALRQRAEREVRERDRGRAGAADGKAVIGRFVRALSAERPALSAHRFPAP